MMLPLQYDLRKELGPYLSMKKRFNIPNICLIFLINTVKLVVNHDSLFLWPLRIPEQNSVTINDCTIFSQLIFLNNFNYAYSLSYHLQNLLWQEVDIYIDAYIDTLIEVDRG